MQSMVILLMEKEAETGLLTREIGSYTVVANGELIDSIFSMYEEDKLIVHLRVTTDRDVEDWEFSAIYDHYNPQFLEQFILSFQEIDDKYNPTWEVTFEFVTSQDEMEKILNMILEKHRQALDHVYEVIQDKKDQYE